MLQSDQVAAGYLSESPCTEAANSPNFRTLGTDKERRGVYPKATKVLIRLTALCPRSIAAEMNRRLPSPGLNRRQIVTVSGVLVAGRYASIVRWRRTGPSAESPGKAIWLVEA